jgi:hypothetical protein
MDDAQFFGRDDFEQKNAQKILSFFRGMYKIKKDEMVQGVFGVPHYNCAVIMPDRLEYKYSMKGKFFDQLITVLYVDISDMGFRSEGGYDYVYIIYNDKTELKIEIDAAKAATQSFLDVLKKCFRLAGKAAGAESPAVINPARCPGCGASVDIGPGSAGVCEYCGKRFK